MLLQSHEEIHTAGAQIWHQRWLRDQLKEMISRASGNSLVVLLIQTIQQLGKSKGKERAETEDATQKFWLGQGGWISRISIPVEKHVSERITRWGRPSATFFSYSSFAWAAGARLLWLHRKPPSRSAHHMERV